MRGGRRLGADRGGRGRRQAEPGPHQPEGGEEPSGRQAGGGQGGQDQAADGDQGESAGLLNATAQIGTAFGLALVTPLASIGGAVGGEVGGAAGSIDARGMRWGFAAAGLIAVLGLAGSRLLPTRRHGERDRAGTRVEAAR